MPWELYLLTLSYRGILQDERYFPNPSDFDPERFVDEGGNLGTDVPDPETVASFGFGRR